MTPAAPEEATFTLTLPNEAAMRGFVIDIAMALEPGDLVTLSGDLGAGKTTLARALIRHLANDETVEVPSPTFTLTQSYRLPRFPLAHADLYRLSEASELIELGLDDLAPDTVVLMEWPERAGHRLPADRMDISLMLERERGLDYREVRVTGYGTLAPRVDRMGAIRHFLNAAGFGRAERTHLQGDASSRGYERLVLDGRSYILMNAPRRADGPPVRDGKPYSAIAHLAEDVVPFVAMAEGLRALGLSAPAIFQVDLRQGLVLLEDLGDERVVAGDPPGPIEERYAAAVDLLVYLHSLVLPAALPVAGASAYRIPHYDLEAFMVEAELLPDWYLPYRYSAAPPATRAEFVALWRDALEPVADAPTATWILRDFHSPNLLWLPERDGIAQVGLLDFQDAQIGPSAYDLASLLQDARVDVAEPLELALLGRYVEGRREGDPNFDTTAFVRLYAILAAQRASKILGIFARLQRRDGKPQYLRHIPRVWSYLQRALAHPALAPLRAWYDAHVPAPPSRRESH